MKNPRSGLKLMMRTGLRAYIVVKLIHLLLASLTKRLLTGKNAEYVAWGVAVCCSLVNAVTLILYATWSQEEFFLDTVMQSASLNFEDYIVITNGIILNVLSIPVLSFFVIIFLTLWPKTRVRSTGRFQRKGDDPSFLIFSLVFLVWVVMRFIAVLTVFYPTDNQFKLSVIEFAIQTGDILNSGLLLLAILQFDFNHQDDSFLKRCALSVQDTLAKKRLVLKLVLATIGINLLLVVLYYGVVGKSFTSLSSLLGRLLDFPSAFFGFGTIAFLGLLLMVLYEERKLNKIRYAILALLGLIFAIYLSMLTSVANHRLILVSTTLYRICLGAVFILLSFSSKEIENEELRFSFLLSAQSQGPHMMNSLVGGLSESISMFLERPTSKQVQLIKERLFTIKTLYELLFKHDKHDKLYANPFKKNMNEIINLYQKLFIQRDGEERKTRIVFSSNLNYSNAESIPIEGDKQIDLLRLITELTLNANKHGYNGLKPSDELNLGNIDLVANYYADKLEFSVIDQGGKLDNTDKKQLHMLLNTPLNQLHTESMGWQIIRTIVSYNKWQVAFNEDYEFGASFTVTVPL